MASVKVAARVRPLNARENGLESPVIIDISGKTISVTNSKIPDHTLGDLSREKLKVFTFDYSYWSVSSKDGHYVPQEQVFEDLGLDIIKSAYDGYNACVFAYGQTGSGKTYTMTGTPGDVGLIPRISESLSQKMTDASTTYRTEVSYFEIYNETVRDLLPSNSNKGNQMLRVREHPKDGPYVEDLSHHIVTGYDDIKELIDAGNSRRTTAATGMNDVSSRSHAIFTIAFTQAKFSKNSPSETCSKIRLVDLAGSERADMTGNTGLRLKEGGSINKSLVTLGNVISALADMSEKSSPRKSVYIPYRDSILTWLLKDSLGGNSKTIMIATVSPAACNYAETVSTLRYANRAKNIINRPTVNEDPNVKLIRELRAEIARLKALLGGSDDGKMSPGMQERLNESEARVKVLTEEWKGRWHETAEILREDTGLALRKDGVGVMLDSDLPHLIGIDDNLLSTGIILYHLKEGQTTIGNVDASEKQDIVLQGVDVGVEHCVVCNRNGDVTLIPVNHSECYVDGVHIADPVMLSQGSMIMLGKTNMFRFNHPTQATKLRKEMKDSNTNLSRMSLLSQSMLEMYRSTDNLTLVNSSGLDTEQERRNQIEVLERKRQEVEDMEEKFKLVEANYQLRQLVQEEELEKKRTLILAMQRETEKLKREAELTQKRVRAEADSLKRRSLNFEMQLQKYHQLGLIDKEDLEKKIQSVAETEHSTNLVQDLESGTHSFKQELRQLESTIRTLKTLETDHGVFESIAGKIEDRDLRDSIKNEIGRMEESLSRVARLKDATCDAYENRRLEIDSQSRAVVSDFEWKLEAMKSENGEEIIGKEMTEAEAEIFEKKRRDGATVEAIFAEERDAAVEYYRKELEELDKSKADREKEMEGVVREATERESVYRGLVADALREKENRRSQLLKIIDDVKTNRGRTMNDNKSENEKSENEKMTKEIDANEINNHFNEKTTKVEKKPEIATSSRNAEHDDTISPFNSLTEETNGSELHSLEEQLRSAESDLESQRDVFEAERQRQLEEIDLERYRLEELEHKEKIDRLVQQEVKRQVLAERIQREKRWAVERAREQAERDRDLEKMKEDHDRQICTLRQKYEGSPARDTTASVAEDSNSVIKQTQDSSSIGGSSFRSDISRSSSQNSLLKTVVEADVIEYHRPSSQTTLFCPVSRTSSSMLLTSTENPFRVKIPSSICRGSGFNVHIEFEVKIEIISLSDGMYVRSIEEGSRDTSKIKCSPFLTYWVSVFEDSWIILRRYRRFYQLHTDMKLKYPEISSLEFPPKKWFTTEKIIADRRVQLESYLQKMLDILFSLPSSPLHANQTHQIYCKQMLCNFHSFFQRGAFEATKHSTC